jgi:hypothetical protein
MAFKRSGVRLPLAPPIKLLMCKDIFARLFLLGWSQGCREAPGKHFAQFLRPSQLHCERPAVPYLLNATGAGVLTAGSLIVL